MLALIRDDTWNVLNRQHITPNSKRWAFSDIPGGRHKMIKGPAYMVEGDGRDYWHCHQRKKTTFQLPVQLDFFRNIRKCKYGFMFPQMSPVGQGLIEHLSLKNIYNASPFARCSAYMGIGIWYVLYMYIYALCTDLWYRWRWTHTKYVLRCVMSGILSMLKISNVFRSKMKLWQRYACGISVPLCAEFTGNRQIVITKSQYCKRSWFLCCQPNKP